MTTTTTPYLETFGCSLETENDHDHEGDCLWGFACGTCGRDVTDVECPDHRPRTPPGMRLMECEATPPHRIWVADREDYGAPCVRCCLTRAMEEHRYCAHSHHRAWRRWKLTHWLASKAYVLGAGKGHATSWGGGCERCLTGFRLGRSSYVLGKPREWWSCLLRRRHLYRDSGCFGLCDRCCPDPAADDWTAIS
jgi:hypothetical protein